jgi:hypothetical protein
LRLETRRRRGGGNLICANHVQRLIASWSRILSRHERDERFVDSLLWQSASARPIISLLDYTLNVSRGEQSPAPMCVCYDIIGFRDRENVTNANVTTVDRDIKSFRASEVN